MTHMDEAIKRIMNGSPPSDWKTTDTWGDYEGYGKRGDPDFVDGVDESNGGDIHDHGYAVGLWEAARLLREAATIDKGDA